MPFINLSSSPFCCWWRGASLTKRETSFFSISKHKPIPQSIQNGAEKSQLSYTQSTHVNTHTHTHVHATAKPNTIFSSVPICCREKEMELKKKQNKQTNMNNRHTTTTTTIRPICEKSKTNRNGRTAGGPSPPTNQRIAISVLPYH